MHTKFLICASRIIIDRNDNKVSAIDIVDNIVSSAFPLTFPQFFVLWVLDKNSHDGQAHIGKVRIKLNDQALGEYDVQINFQSSESTRAALIINNLTIPGPGALVVTADIPATPSLPQATYIFKVDSQMAPASSAQ